MIATDVHVLFFQTAAVREQSRGTLREDLPAIPYLSAHGQRLHTHTHCNPNCDTEDVKRARELGGRAASHAVEVGFTVPDEFEIGVCKTCHLLREHGKDHVAA